MHYEESTELGEKLLNQALRALNADLAGVGDEQWEKLLRDITAKSRQELFADIGLGKRFAAVVARKLLAASEQPLAEGNAGRSSFALRRHGGAVRQMLPADSRRPIIGSIKKGQGIVIHTSDCPTAAKSRTDPDKWLDVEWAPEPARMFDVGIHVTVKNQRGVLAKVAGRLPRTAPTSTASAWTRTAAPTPICTLRCRSLIASIWHASSAACAAYRRSFASRG